MTETTTAATEPGGLAGALLAAQAAMHGVAKSGRNTQQGWSFVTVEDVTRAARECLTGAGLVAVYRLTADADPAAGSLDGYLHVLHPGSGEELRLAMPWPIERAGPQARRAAFSYARKQALVELLLVAEPDDPETTATTTASTSEQQVSSTHRARGSAGDPKPMSDRQRRALWAKARSKGYGDSAELGAWAAGVLGLPADGLDLSALTSTEASHLLDALDHVQVAHRSQPDGPDPEDPWAITDPGHDEQEATP